MGRKILNAAFYAVVACYVFLMLDLHFRIGIVGGGAAGSRGVNWIPFGTIWGYLGGANGVSGSRAVQNLLGNVLSFVPYGLFLQTFLRNKRIGKSLLIALGTSVAIEVIQLAFGLGSCDVDDVLLNVCGGAVGILGYRVLGKLFPEPGKTKTAVAVVTLALGIPVLLFYLRALLFRFL